jgi:hypothetical protein
MLGKPSPINKVGNNKRLKISSIETFFTSGINPFTVPVNLKKLNQNMFEKFVVLGTGCAFPLM